MKLLYLNYKRSNMWNMHYLYATFQCESGKIFTSKEPFLMARTKDALYERAEFYPYRIMET